MRPTTSIIIPTYNRANLVKEAVESVLAQSFTDFELIVIDDGSTDNTRESLAPYLDSLRYIYQENRGVSAARNLGISVARGRYIAFLDSDDLWLKDKLLMQVDFMEQNPEAQICYTEEIWYRNGRRVNPKLKHRKYSGWIFERSLALCIISPSSVLLRKELLDRVGGFDEGLPACEDYDLWLRITKDYPVYLIDRPLIVKRNGHPGQLSQKYWGLDRFRVRSLEKLLRERLTPQQRAGVIEQLVFRTKILARGAFKRKKLPTGIYYGLKLWQYLLLRRWDHLRSNYHGGRVVRLLPLKG